MTAFENENTVFRDPARVDREYESAMVEIRKRAGQSHPMLVAGKEVRGTTTFDSLDPSTGEVVARFPRGTKADVDAAVAAAKAAQPAWEALGWEARAGIIERA